MEQRGKKGTLNAACTYECGYGEYEIEREFLGKIGMEELLGRIIQSHITAERPRSGESRRDEGA